MRHAIALRVAALALAGCGSAGMPAEPPGPADITVAITSPAAGAELVAADSPKIRVTGTVTTSDPSRGALEAWVNGARVDVTAGAFTAELTPEAGINHIKVEGGNGVDPLVSHEIDVAWAGDYLPPRPGQTGFDLADALELRLGQRFFDARLQGTALDRSTDPVVARDVASALELILWNIDLARLLPGGIHAGGSGAALDIAIPSVAPSNIVVDARVVDTPQPAIDLRIDLLGVFLAMTGQLTFNGRALAVAGGLTADLHAGARLVLGTAADGSIDVSVAGVTATVGSMEPGFTGSDGPELDALITIGGNDVRALIEGLVTSQLIPTFTDRLPPLLEQLLGAADQLLADLHFTLDLGYGNPITLQLGGHLGGLDIAAGATAGHVTVRQDLTVQTTSPPIHATSRGAPRLDPASPAPTLDTAGLHLGVRLDLFNALLHALWNSGILEGQLTSSGLSATVSARLPPLVRPAPASLPCKIDNVRCDVELQLGQVELQIAGFDQTFAISASAGARIKLDGATVSLAIEMEPTLRVWETSTSAAGPALSPDTVRALISSVVWPELFGAIGTNLTIQLPLPDLAALGLTDLAPGLANAALSLEAAPRPTVTPSQLVLGADLTLATPPAP